MGQIGRIPSLDIDHCNFENARASAVQTRRQPVQPCSRRGHTMLNPSLDQGGKLQEMMSSLSARASDAIRDALEFQAEHACAENQSNIDEQAAWPEEAMTKDIQTYVDSIVEKGKYPATENPCAYGKYPATENPCAYGDGSTAPCSRKSLVKTRIPC